MPLCDAAWKIVPMGFTTATMVAEQRQDMIQVCTGCKELDTILEGELQAAAVGHLEQSASRLARRWHGDRLHHRDLWREPLRQDAAVSYALRDLPGADARRARAPLPTSALTALSPADAHQHGRRRGQGDVHRHRGHLQAGAHGGHSREVLWLAGRERQTEQPVSSVLAADLGSTPQTCWTTLPTHERTTQTTSRSSCWQPPP